MLLVFVPQDLTLKAAEKEAQDAEKGLWAKDASTHVRNVTWEVPDARQLVEQYRGRRIKAVVENVRDGSTVRAFLLPDFYHVTIMLSGVRVSYFSLNLRIYWLLKNIKNDSSLLHHQKSRPIFSTISFTKRFFS